MDLFFYGTLMDRDVLGRVLGRPMAATRLKPATLPGWRRARALGQSYPIVVVDPAAAVEGMVVRRLAARDVARLCRYEGDGYELVPIDVTQNGGRRRVHFFRPRTTLQPDPRPWDLASWMASEKAAFLDRIARHLVA